MSYLRHLIFIWKYLFYRYWIPTGSGRMSYELSQRDIISVELLSTERSKPRRGDILRKHTVIKTFLGLLIFFTGHQCFRIQNYDFRFMIAD